MDWEAQETPGRPSAEPEREWRPEWHPEQAEPYSAAQEELQPTGSPSAEPQPTEPSPPGTEPADQPAAPPSAGTRPGAHSGLIALPIISRPLINPRLAADPRLRIWAARAAMSLAIYLAIMIWFGWRIGLSVAIGYAVADTIYRSKTMAVIPPAARVTSAQRSTRRRLSVLRPAGYLALHACRVPGTGSIIDHVVVGPAGVYTLDSERLDRRLPVRAIGGMLYHGPVSQEGRLDHAREEAQRAANLIGAELGHPIRVRPVMVVYGPDLPWVVIRLKGVDVFDGGRVGTYFRRQSKAAAGHHLDTGQVAVIFAAAARALQPIR